MTTPVPNHTVEEIAEALRGHRSFVVLGHMRPDGDAIGCQIALGLALRQMGKEVAVWNEDGLPDRFAFLPGAELVERPPAAPRAFDVAVALDTAVFDRVGSPLLAVGGTPLWVNIDHHVTNTRYGDLRLIDPQAPATGEILFEFLRRTGLPITHGAADSLFVAISTDTGSFQYPSTTARTFEIGAELVRMGVNVGELSRRVYGSQPLRRLRLLRALLDTLVVECEGRLASVALTAAQVEELGTLPDDTENQIDHIRGIEGVVAAAFFEELPEGKVRISLRSKDPRVDVSRLASRFGGGGHTLAAGARKRGSIEAVRREVLDAACAEIRAAGIPEGPA
jgi:phosphoesterase RecJ-like protein